MSQTPTYVPSASSHCLKFNPLNLAQGEAAQGEEAETLINGLRSTRVGAQREGEKGGKWQVQERKEEEETWSSAVGRSSCARAGGECSSLRRFEVTDD